MTTTTAVLAVTAIGATTAHADGHRTRGSDHTRYQSTPTAGKNDAAFCQFSPDGDTWMSAAEYRTNALRTGTDGTVQIGVRGIRRDHPCTVSLASYGAHGATWQTSGKQAFQDFDTVTVGRHEHATLDITVPAPECFAQVDLYVGNTKHDGKSGDLPEGPNHPVFGDNLIAAWHGGTRTCEAAPTKPPATAPATTPPATAPATTPPATAPATTPPATATAPATTPPATTTAPATTPPATTPASSTAAAAPSTSDSGNGSLAHTGSSNAVPVAAGTAAVLLALGGGLFVTARRRKVAREH
ncbi:LPXTG cell wall anchor domain-containing protein [Streptomyces sp. NBC_01341]|uniref:LAETG motif-containing sortase-dependent surface protein n=1 Tax=Streptomyces sp. NBC_01341 TaxID=2903831 RepID=UPI002E14EDFF|nr:LPXTG cell wall anchor domain-containing protein [Streptomyces sp. NBC_01341]